MKNHNKNRKIITYIGFFLIILTFTNVLVVPQAVSQSENNDSIYDLHKDIGLEGKLDLIIFERAIFGLNSFSFDKPYLITIIDFNKASYEDRLFVIDLKKKKLVYNCLVAHGKNTGAQFADTFSNEHRSLKSSPGFYSTAETYFGKHGYSLTLDGLEKGINDNARKRYIVIHGATYVSDDFISKHGRIGRSWGCPALPVDLSEAVINLIKEGSCLYIHTDSESYLKHSAL